MNKVEYAFIKKDPRINEYLVAKVVHMKAEDYPLEFNPKNYWTINYDWEDNPEEEKEQ